MFASVRETSLVVRHRFACELERYVGIPRPCVLSLDGHEYDFSTSLQQVKQTRITDG